MNKKILLIVLIVFANLLALKSQIEDPVKWDFSIEKINDSEYWLIYDAKIDAKWHLYSQYFPEGGPVKMTVSFNKATNYKTIGKVIEVTKPHTEYDDIFEIDIQYFSDKAQIKQKIKALSSDIFVIKGELDYQVCFEDKCVLFSKDFEFKITGAKASSNDIDNNTEQIKIDSIKIDSIPITNTTKITKTQAKRSKTTPIIAKNNKWKNNDINGNSSLIYFFFLAFGFGFMALLTPCVFPMIPMTVSFFMHGGENKTKNKLNAAIYGISIVLIYTVPIALIIALANVFGNNSVSGDFANFLSTHWIPNIFFFLIFMVFAASFFGMFEIVLPSWLVAKSDKQVDRGGIIGVFFMAFTLVLVSFSCTGPIVGGILVESTQGGQILKPIIGMLGFSIGVAAPFTFFAFFPEMLKKLPQSGGWLNSVKVVLGFIELALGLKFLSVADQTYHWGLLDREIYLALWIIIFTLMGLYLLGKIKFSHDSEVKFLKVPRLMLVIITFAFVLYLIPGMVGAPLKALSGYLPPQSTHDFDLMKMIRGETESNICERPKHADKLHLPHGIHGYFDYHQALACSKEQNKPIFVDFTGHGCVNCREMEANVWSDPRVLKILKEDYIVLALYVDDKKIDIPESEWFESSFDSKIKKTLGKQNADIQIVNFNKNSQPYYVLLDNNSNVLIEPRAYNLNVEDFIEFLKKGKAEFDKK